MTSQTGGAIAAVGAVGVGRSLQVLLSVALADEWLAVAATGPATTYQAATAAGRPPSCMTARPSAAEWVI